jgi:hypothetical protein
VIGMRGIMKRGTLKRKVRLRQAVRWVAEYNGKHLIKGYSKRFKVDLLCANGGVYAAVRIYGGLPQKIGLSIAQIIPGE